MIFSLLSLNSLSQTGSIEGKIIGSESGEPLVGATVKIKNTSLGAISGKDGFFKIDNVPAGNYVLLISYIGFENGTKEVLLKGEGTIFVEIKLVEKGVYSKSISVVASRAKFRETPVAFTDIPKTSLETKLGSRDLPLILNETPGVYATQAGGGAGDSRINIRGFDQRNINVMINGVPVNDMENGWVYWSNWDGLGDVTSSIQIQRGLGAGKMANPSVGGTMNIITDPSKQQAGAKFKQEIGNDGFLKTTIVGHSGDLGGFAVSAAGVRKSGDGVIDKTWTDAWAYYLGLKWNATQEHQFEFYLIGAPQQHGQRSYQQPIAYYDGEYAKDNGVPDSIANKGQNLGIVYNPNWGLINWGSKKTKDYYNGSEHDPRFDNVLMERENYYHKPQMNLNWYWQISPDFSLTNVFYLSTGIGGGSGSAGKFYYNEKGNVNFDTIYAINTSTVNQTYDPTLKQSKAILRNSVNQHFWVGWLGTADSKLTENIRFQGGLDVRYYEGQHWTEIRNLIGGDYYIDQSDKTLDYTANPKLAMKKTGDKISYHNDGLVNWIGGFAQAEYKDNDITAYVNLSLSQTGYKRIDYFRTDTMPNGRETDWANFIGYTFKTGANYNINSNFNIYLNAGYYSRAPLFRNVYYFDNSKYDNITNEKVLAVEGGAGYWSEQLVSNLNLYYTEWNDRSWYLSSYITDGQGNRVYFNYNLPGINAVHIGTELDFSYKPLNYLAINGAISLGDWKWANDVEASYSPEGQDTVFKTKLYADGLKVGDAAQKTFSIGVTVFAWDESSVNFTYKFFTDNYANFDPATRTDPNDKAQPWKIPDYGQLDAHLFVKIPIELPVDVILFGHVFNLLDTKFITDATDGKSHDAATAKVFFGYPMTFNLGVQINY